MIRFVVLSCSSLSHFLLHRKLFYLLLCSMREWYGLSCCLYLMNRFYVVFHLSSVIMNIRFCVLAVQPV